MLGYPFPGTLENAKDHESRNGIAHDQLTADHRGRQVGHETLLRPRFVQYYLFLRRTYAMVAWEAFEVAKKVFREYPEFMDNPTATLQKWLGEDR